MIPFEGLIQKYLDGLASEEERRELERLLSGSPQAADAFARASRLDRALESLYREDQAVSAVRSRIEGFRRGRLFRAALSAAAVLLAATAVFLVWGAGRPLYLVDGRPGSALGSPVRGPASITFPEETTRLDLSSGGLLILDSLGPAKRLTLSEGSLHASVAHQPAPMLIQTPHAQVHVLGTRFTLIAAAASTRLEVTEGRVRLSRGDQALDVAADEAAEVRARSALAKSNLYEDRFASLWRDLHDPRNGYFSADGIPYHSIETLIVDAPDYGHLTTSETFSYWLWLEAMHGRQTGDWRPFGVAWRKMEETLVPSSAAQPTNDLYSSRKPASYVPEGDRLSDYPLSLDPSFPVGADPLFAPLQASYGSADLYLMHWLVDVDDFYGYGKRAFVNTFERGPSESVWKAVPHPSQERFQAGGPHGFLDLFLKESAYARQWRYTCAPDADARAIQAAYWATRWVRQQGKNPASELPLAKVARMGDSLRYALFDKYFKTMHGLIAWSAGWGGSIDRAAGWAWRSGSSHVHFGYQNPLAAWALATDPLLEASTAGAREDWTASLARQVEFYRWLQSSEGAISGGATSSWNGRYEPVPPDRARFHELSYVEHPVFRDPPSNEWFGWQAWSMGRLAQYARLAGDASAGAVVDRWASWARSVVRLGPDGTYTLPATLGWSGQPGAGLHVATRGRTSDVGVAAALARALIAQGAPESRDLARELLDRMWDLYRDDRGVANPEIREDYRRFGDPAELPPGWKGTLPSGQAVSEGATFLDLRPGYRKDPGFPSLERSLRSGIPGEYLYHRFWAQVEIALANAEYAHLWK